MSHDLIPISNEKKYSYTGVFNLEHCYHFIKSFLGDSRHYDLSENTLEETNNNGTRAITAIWMAEQEYTDYYKILLKVVFIVKGVDKVVEIDGKPLNMVEGTVKMSVFPLIEPDFMAKKPKGLFAKFVEQVHNTFFGGVDEYEACKNSALNDTEEFLNRFKQSINSRIQ